MKQQVMGLIDGCRTGGGSVGWSVDGAQPSDSERASERAGDDTTIEGIRKDKNSDLAGTLSTVLAYSSFQTIRLLARLVVRAPLIDG